MIPYSYDSTTVPRTDVEYPSAYCYSEAICCNTGKTNLHPKLLPAPQFLIALFKRELFPVTITTDLRICNLLFCSHKQTRIRSFEIPSNKVQYQQTLQNYYI